MNLEKRREYLRTIRKGMQTPGDEKSPPSKKEEKKWDRL